MDFDGICRVGFLGLSDRWREILREKVTPRLLIWVDKEYSRETRLGDSNELRFGNTGFQVLIEPPGGCEFRAGRERSELEIQM